VVSTARAHTAKLSAATRSNVIRSLEEDGDKCRREVTTGTYATDLLPLAVGHSIARFLGVAMMLVWVRLCLSLFLDLRIPDRLLIEYQCQ
jgi:hypothetical protein